MSDVSPLTECKCERTLHIDDYAPFVGKAFINKLKRMAEPVAGKGWANVSSSFVGGGIAEMLKSEVPLARDLGLDAKWYIMKGSREFHQVTKKFHNLLQGVNMNITLEEIFGVYLDTIDANARRRLISSDMVIIHDPQPAALVMNGVIFGNILWRCHIDTSMPNPVIWRFLLPYINHCSGAIFTMPEYVGPGLQIPLYQIMPCIDPLASKNREFSQREALEILHPLLKKDHIDPDRPIIAAVSRYDLHKNQRTILRAYRFLKGLKKYDPPPYLIFLGDTATDDPEGGVVLGELQIETGNDPDVIYWVNVKNNDDVVGALMRLAKVFVHASTREGFGLVVSEAMWQGTPVIGSKVGGITKQVIEGENGFLVDPLDVVAIAEKIAWILDHPDEACQMGAEGRRHVGEHFLVPELLRRYLVLLNFYTRNVKTLPDFRLDDLSYSEVIHSIRRDHPYLHEIIGEKK